MGKWTPPIEHIGLGGVFRIFARRYSGAPVEITYLRGVPVKLTNYGAADPFGDTACQISLPQVTVYDDPTGSDLVDWFADEADIDIYWWRAQQVVEGSAPDLYINPLTERRDLQLLPTGKKVWEGYIANIGYTEGTASLQCQGALLQHDGHLSRPQYPSRPIPIDDLLISQFDIGAHPDLRTMPLRIDYPDGWNLIGPAYDTANLYTPNVEPGRKWTGYATRQTGAWEHALTGWAQEQLGYMITQPTSGVTTGNQWTISLEHETDSSPGRQPVLHVRDRLRPVDVEMWVGTPGLKENLQHDTTQSANVMFGEGTGLDGTVWRQAVISNDGQVTDYAPLAFDRTAYPYQDNPRVDRGRFVRETYVRFGAGFDQPTAVTSGAEQLQRMVDPGWSGSLTLQVDPSADLSRWEIQVGWTFLLKGFRGGDLRLHIASISASPEDGSLTMQVDDRYRDLVTVAQALERNRDSLTPSKALQVNKASQIVEDIQAPWDYTAGSGFMPKASVASYAAIPAPDLVFPYQDWVSAHPPSRYPSWYVPCQANAADRASRWAGPIPILMSERGTIRRTEVFMVDAAGNPVKSRFHVSLYYVQVTPTAMPKDGDGPSPWIAGAFETINVDTGQEYPAGNFLKPDESYIIGWGNFQQPAGYSPGRYTDAAAATGKLIDESTWTFDCTNNPNYNKLAKPGDLQVASAITIYAMFYAEYVSPVYFGGRLFRQPQGS